MTQLFKGLLTIAEQYHVTLQISFYSGSANGVLSSPEQT